MPCVEGSTDSLDNIACLLLASQVCLQQVKKRVDVKIRIDSVAAENQH